MTFSTIVAKYPGTCRRCSDPISPGERIRWAGRGRTYHLASACHQAEAFAPDRNATTERERDFARQQAGERAIEDAAAEAAYSFGGRRLDR